MPEVYMNARRVEQEKIMVNDKSKLFPVIYEAGYIYDLPEPTAKAWLRVAIALPIVGNQVTLRNGKTVTLSPAKRAQLLREPSRPNHPHLGKKTRPTLEPDAPAPKATSKKKVKKTAKKKTTRKAAKKAGKRSKKKK